MRYFSAATLLFVVYFLLILLALPSQPFNDPGAFWHVRVGEWIFEHLAFPHTDPFTFSFADKPWVPQQWGAECLMALLSRMGGADALLVTMAALIAGLGAWISSRFIASGWHPLPTLLIVGFGLSVSMFHFYARPHLITLVLMAYFMSVIVDTERERNTYRRWYLLLPLSVLWTNLHGGVVGGLATLVAALGGWCVWSILKKPSPVKSVRIAGIFAAIIGVGCALTLVNPFGLQMHRIWFSLIDSKVLKEVITEHQPLSLQRSEGQAIFAFGIFYLLMLLGTLPRWPRVSWLIPILWFVGALTSIRHGPIFSVVALVGLADLLPETIWYRYLKKHGDSLIREPYANLWSIRSLLIPGLFVGLCFGLESARVKVPLIGAGWAYYNPKNMPLELIEPLQQYAASRPVGTPIFNDANLGGFVLGFAPSLKIFMDDRCELYGDAWLRKYFQVLNETPEVFDEWSHKWNFERVLIALPEKPEETTRLAEYLAHHAEWREIFRCPLAVMYERKTP
ncbi:hypothetical protein KIH39_23815 [Telmatocola sphagniphila]|uniref:Uncharacterized protein n=1 Tax=Telmatocola sphagniphila TaxID=1123043 RepID=A0A8E6B4M1_9BACT|nr:hypothetical protein [Telmatocola sphagniphila]QVL31827.1 hypothetical protein KIH39_23815 [Telmatocola sphagniphila]